MAPPSGNPYDNIINDEETAGKAIAAGGFGCVFDPALKCKSNNKNKKNTVSKLLLKRHANSEMNEIKSVLSYVKHIPNHEKYFLLNDISECIPDKLSSDDLHNFNHKCKSLYERGYSTDNINRKINDFRIINMPHGGDDIDKFFENLNMNKPSDRKEFVETNKALVNLLTNAIQPLNKSGYLHMDIKGQNIMRKKVNNNETSVKLIDWGLSGAVTDKGVPEFMNDRVVQYNVPFSNILFSNPELNKLLKKNILALNASPKLLNGTEIGRDTTMKVVAYRQLVESIAYIGNKGHIGYLDRIFKKIYGGEYSLNEANSNDINSKVIIVDYNARVLGKFITNSGDFDKDTFFQTVFRKNADVWGFITAYISLIDKNKPPSWMDNLFENALLRIFSEYCFSGKYAIEPIPIDKLAKELLSLNSIVIDATKKKSTKKKSTKKKSTKKKSTKKKKRKGRSKRKNKSNTKKIHINEQIRNHKNNHKLKIIRNSI